MNVNKPVIVTGEAPETDSEDEQANIKTEEPHLSKPVHGAVISGEDSESENEVGNDLSTAVSILCPELPRSTHKRTYDSLLHKKLRESNMKLNSDLDAFVQIVIDEAGNSISFMNQQLLKSQLILQGAVSSLRALHMNSVKINSKLQAIVSSAFISNINKDN